MEQIGWTSIVLSVLTLLGGCGWLIDRKKHRQEIESLKADNRQKDMNRRTSERRGQAGLDYPEREGGNAKRNLSRDYVTEWRTYIAEPLQREVGDKEERLVVRTDTVYIEKRDSSLRLSSLGAYGLQEDGTPTVSGKLSAVSKILKWITALVCAVVVLILVIRLKC